VSGAASFQRSAGIGVGMTVEKGEEDERRCVPGSRRHAVLDRAACHGAPAARASHA
jgi:hypothetical protein